MNPVCPTCANQLIKSPTLSGAPSEFWFECTKCNTFINTYTPQDHQQATHVDSHLYIMNAGAYGSGKTLTSRQEVYRHILITPKANILIGAKTSAQYKQTIKRDIENDFPKAMVKKVSVQDSYIDFINGARLMFKSFDDPDKLRSLNLTMFVIVEASETTAETFQQLKTRLRNDMAFTDTHDWRKGIIETNPGAGWIRSDVLLNAESISVHGDTTETYPESLSPDPNISVHITTTSANKYLPPNFITELSTNRPLWWVKKYIYGSFQYAEGLVYPAAATAIINAFEVPKVWRRLVACDYGLSDKFAFVAVAVSPAGIAYVYKNKTTVDMNIEALSNMYYDFVDDIPYGGLYTAPIMDPKSGAKRDYNKKTLYDHFLDYGIFFQPGHVSVDARVFRLNTFLQSGRLKIMDNCTELIEEIQEYKFPEKTLNKSKHNQDKPIDKNNHSINPLEWITMALPADPSKLDLVCSGSFYNNANNTHSSSDTWQLQDSEPKHNVSIFTLPS